MALVFKAEFEVNYSTALRLINGLAQETLSSGNYYELASCGVRIAKSANSNELKKYLGLLNKAKGSCERNSLNFILVEELEKHFKSLIVLPSAWYKSGSCTC